MTKKTLREKIKKLIRKQYYNVFFSAETLSDEILKLVEKELPKEMSSHNSESYKYPRDFLYKFDKGWNHCLDQIKKTLK